VKWAAQSGARACGEGRKQEWRAFRRIAAGDAVIGYAFTLPTLAYYCGNLRRAAAAANVRGEE
jgi:hypothetical protein